MAVKKKVQRKRAATRNTVSKKTKVKKTKSPPKWLRTKSKPKRVKGPYIRPGVTLPRRRERPDPRLTIELVPETAWMSNVRTAVKPSDWDLIRKASYSKAGYRCEICGGVGRTHPVECHEIWKYDDELKTQTLLGFVSLCPPCHEVKHFGYARTQGKNKQATKHLAKVNAWEEFETLYYIQEQFEVWERRSKVQWKLNLDYLNTLDFPVEVVRKERCQVLK
jgi:hypothetical protein